LSPRRDESERSWIIERFRRPALPLGAFEEVGRGERAILALERLYRLLESRKEMRVLDADEPPSRSRYRRPAELDKTLAGSVSTTE